MKKLLFIITFFFTVILIHLFYTTNLKFISVGDNISYLMQSESLYYDHDFKLENKDFTRTIEKYSNFIKTIPILSKNNDGKLTYGKPVFFTLYYSSFTPINNPFVRAYVANGILLLILFIISFIILNKKFIKEKYFYLYWILFSLLLFFSQMNFYLPQIHPEIFTNLIILVSTLPLFIENKKSYLYFISGFIGGIIIFEKQLAIVFPLITLIYLFFYSKRKNLIFYFISFSIAIIFGLIINYLLHGDFIAYLGIRGLTLYNKGSLMFSGGNINVFTFPTAYFNRFIDYFLGRNIGIFVYNAILIVFILFGLYWLVIKKSIKYFIFFLPVLIFIFIYFFAVDIQFSYGGATTIGNRYIFQISFYILLIIFYLLSFVKGIVKKILISLIILIIIFEASIFRPFYNNFKRAITDHLVIAYNNKPINYFPLEVAYVRIANEELTIANRIGDIYIINKSFPIIQEGDGKWLPEGIVEIVELSNSDFKFERLLENINNNKVEINTINTFYLSYLNKDGVYYAYYKVKCQTNNADKDKCLFVKTNLSPQDY